MNFFSNSLLTLMGACLSFGLLAAPLEISGVSVEPSVTVSGVRLNLNGVGIRYKGLFKVNVVEMHAIKKFSSIEELIALPGPKRVTLTMLREVPSDMTAKTMTRGIEDNFPKTELSKIIPSLIRMSDIFGTYKVLSPGDKILIEWIPGIGTVLSVKGKVQGEAFKDPEFFRALMSIWLGTAPVDFKLKDALLGQN